jgi:hypothetical protein
VWQIRPRPRICPQLEQPPLAQDEPHDAPHEPHVPEAHGDEQAVESANG